MAATSELNLLAQQAGGLGLWAFGHWDGGRHDETTTEYSLPRQSGQPVLNRTRVHKFFSRQMSTAVDPMTLPRYAIRAPGAAGATVKQRAEALSEDGPLEVGPAHLVPLLLPDAFGKTAGGADWDTNIDSKERSNFRPGITIS